MLPRHTNSVITTGGWMALADQSSWSTRPDVSTWCRGSRVCERPAHPPGRDDEVTQTTGLGRHSLVRADRQRWGHSEVTSALYCRSTTLPGTVTRAPFDQQQAAATPPRAKIFDSRDPCRRISRTRVRANRACTIQIVPALRGVPRS